MLPLLVNLNQQDEYIKIVIQISFNALKDTLNHFWSKTRKAWITISKKISTNFTLKKSK